MKRAQLGGVWLLLVTVCAASCRHVSVCDGDSDCARATSTAGVGGALVPAAADGKGAPGVGDDAGGAAGTQGGGGVSAGAGSNASVSGGAAGEATGGAPPFGPRCGAGLADCDESSLTVCETPTNFSFRHCGACDARCDGICSVGKCKPSENLFDKGVQSFAANAIAAYALISAPDDVENLHRFDLDSGADSLLVEGLEEDAALVLGANRLYLYYSGYPGRVVSMALDGSGAKTEAFAPESFGATKDGVYYTSYVTNPKTEVDTWTLWFRPQASSVFTALSKGKECDILGSSSQALLVKRETAGAAEILLAHGAELTLLGDSPGEALAAAPAGDGAVFLLSDSHELVWLEPDASPKHLELEADLEDFNLVPAPDGVALQLEDRNNTFVRLFSSDGAEAVALGIPTNSTVVYVDERHVWYSWYGAPDLSQHFERARQFEPDDLLP